MLISNFFESLNSVGNFMQKRTNNGLKVEILMYGDLIHSIIQPEL